MQSKNKKPMTRFEHAHVGRIKEMSCAVCEKEGPSEAHEIKQGLWFLALPLCPDCHRGHRNGLHGQRAMWNIMKKTEELCLHETLTKLYGGLV